MYDLIRKDEKKSTNAAKGTDSPWQQKKMPNRTGMPDRMKQYFEESSGLSMDDIRIHYNSDRPAKIQALAYAQGEEIYLGPGQEKHLPHELGHVIQQKKGMVQPTGSVNHMPVNCDARLEADADRRSMQYQMDCGMERKSVAVERKAPRHIIQGIWVLIQGNTTYTNMKKNTDGSGYTYGGRQYIDTGERDRSGHIIVAAAFKFGCESQAAADFTAHGKTEIPTPYGMARAHRGWGGQPFVQTRKIDFGNETLGNSYPEIIRGLRSSNLSDAEIAQNLLSGSADGLSQLFCRAAAMLHSVVAVAEEYRSSDFPPICRAVLRRIEKGEITFDDFAQHFQAAVTKKKGIAQADHIRLVINRKDDDSDGPPSPRTAGIIANLSPDSKRAFTIGGW